MEEVKSCLEYLDQKEYMPDPLLLTKIFSNKERICKVRKKNDPGWAKLDSKGKVKNLQKVYDIKKVEHQRGAI